MARMGKPHAKESDDHRDLRRSSEPLSPHIRIPICMLSLAVSFRSLALLFHHKTRLLSHSHVNGERG